MGSREIEVVVISYSNTPLLKALTHQLSHKHLLKATIITHKLTPLNSDTGKHNLTVGQPHHENHSSSHHKITYLSLPALTVENLSPHIQTAEILISLDISTSHLLISHLLPALQNLKLFIPPPTQFPLSNPHVLSTLPTYHTHFQLHAKLDAGAVQWRALVTGVVLEEGVREGGVLGVDCLWGTVVVFLDKVAVEVPISTYGSIARRMVDLEVEAGRGEVRWCLARVGMTELVSVIEIALGKKLDRYEGDLDHARGEAEERVRLGYFDGGVGLLEKVVCWDASIGTWEGEWGEGGGGWGDEVKRIVGDVRSGGSGSSCGC